MICSNGNYVVGIRDWIGWCCIRWWKIFGESQEGTIREEQAVLDWWHCGRRCGRGRCGLRYGSEFGLTATACIQLGQSKNVAFCSVAAFVCSLPCFLLVCRAFNLARHLFRVAGRISPPFLFLRLPLIVSLSDVRVECSPQPTNHHHCPHGILLPRILMIKIIQQWKDTFWCNIGVGERHAHAVVQKAIATLVCLWSEKMGDEADAWQSRDKCLLECTVPAFGQAHGAGFRAMPSYLV